MKKNGISLQQNIADTVNDDVTASNYGVSQESLMQTHCYAKQEPG